MATTPVRVLGIDPGLTRCGLGVVVGPAAAPRAAATAVVRTPVDLPLEQRLLRLRDAVRALVAEAHPDVVACEQVLFSRNVRTAMTTGQAAGVALLAAAEAGLPVVSYPPTEVKLAVAGHGGADKDAVARMVAAQLRLPAAPRPADLADALAVALCHLARHRVAARAAGGPGGSAGVGARGWEAVLERPHVRVAGGTAPARDRSGRDTFTTRRQP